VLLLRVFHDILSCVTIVMLSLWSRFLLDKLIVTTVFRFSVL